MSEANEKRKPGFFQLDKVLEEISKDDQEEWEYEYSTTETETYYLTLDLSHPDFKEKPRRVNHHRGRGIYHGVRAPDRAETERAKATRKPNAQEEDAEQDVDEDGGEDDEGAAAPVGRGKDKEATPEGAPDKQDQDEALRDIQILDFHTQNPLISYRGRYFEGSWSEIIGTEALLLHDPSPSPSSSSLPALRHLPDDINLLAMSASKILTKERAPKPPASETTASLEPIKKEFNIRIPVGKDTKRGERRDQARFLENLMAVKKRREEGDLVTVYAKEGRGMGRERGKQVERRGRGRGGKRGGRQGGEGGKGLSVPTPRRWEDGRGSAGPSGGRGQDEDVVMSDR